MRVIAGRFGGRTLVAPSGRGTRPTADRVREALFSILGGVLTSARVLDLYAGTGALGIEALSRGAKTVTFVEHGRAPLLALRRNIGALELAEEAEILPFRVERALANLARERRDFDLVLVDPPYDQVPSFALALASTTRENGHLVAPDGRLVLEHASSAEAPALDGLVLGQSRRYGDSALSFYGVE